MKRWIAIFICILLTQAYAQQNTPIASKAGGDKVAWLVPTNFSNGQLRGTTAFAIDRKAYNIVKKMAEKYRSLKSYLFEGTIRTEMNTEGKLDKFEMPFTIAAVNPGKMLLKFRNSYATSITITIRDTTRLYIGDRKLFTRQVVTPVGSAVDSLIRINAMGSSGIDILGEYWSILSKLQSLRFVREESIAWGGTRVPCFVVDVRLIPTPLPGDLQLNTKRRILWIDQRLNIVLVDSMSYTTKAPQWAHAREMSMVRRFASAKLNEKLPDSLFVFTLPPGAHLVDEFGHNTSLEGKVATAFSLKDTQGRTISLESLRGKVVLLDFWASWCGPCREELPTIQKLHKDLSGRGLEVLGINDESAEEASKFMNEQRYSFSTLVDTEGKAHAAYNVSAIPVEVIIDKSGKIVACFVGSQSEEVLRKALEKAGIR